MIGAPELAPDWIEDLDEFLMSDHAPDDCLQLSDLDGFLTGVAIGPDLIMPSEWMPVIWQGRVGDNGCGAGLSALFSSSHLNDLRYVGQDHL